MFIIAFLPSRLLHFAGDTLWQGEDDKKVVTLIRRNKEVQVHPLTHSLQNLCNLRFSFNEDQELIQDFTVSSSMCKYVIFRNLGLF